MVRNGWNLVLALLLVLTGPTPFVSATPVDQVESPTCCGGDCRCGDSCPCVAKSTPAPPQPDAPPAIVPPPSDRLSSLPARAGFTEEPERTPFEPATACGTRSTQATDGRRTLLRKHVLRT